MCANKSFSYDDLTEEEFKKLGGYFDPEDDDLCFGSLSNPAKTRESNALRRKTVFYRDWMSEEPKNNSKTKEESFSSDDNASDTSHIHKLTPFSRPSQSRISGCWEKRSESIAEESNDGVEEEDNDSDEIYGTPIKSMRQLRKSRTNHSVLHSLLESECELSPDSVGSREEYVTTPKKIIDERILETPKQEVNADKDGGYLTVFSEIAIVKAAADQQTSQVKCQKQLDDDVELPYINIIPASPLSQTEVSPCVEISNPIRKCKLIYNSPDNKASGNVSEGLDECSANTVMSSQKMQDLSESKEDIEFVSAVECFESLEPGSESEEETDLIEAEEYCLDTSSHSLACDEICPEFEPEEVSKFGVSVTEEIGKEIQMKSSESFEVKMSDEELMRLMSEILGEVPEEKYGGQSEESVDVSGAQEETEQPIEQSEESAVVLGIQEETEQHNEEHEVSTPMLWAQEETELQTEQSKNSAALVLGVQKEIAQDNVQNKVMESTVDLGVQKEIRDDMEQSEESPAVMLDVQEETEQANEQSEESAEVMLELQEEIEQVNEPSEESAEVVLELQEETKQVNEPREESAEGVLELQEETKQVNEPREESAEVVLELQEETKQVNEPREESLAVVLDVQEETEQANEPSEESAEVMLELQEEIKQVNEPSEESAEVVLDVQDETEQVNEPSEESPAVVLEVQEETEQVNEPSEESPALVLEVQEETEQANEPSEESLAVVLDVQEETEQVNEPSEESVAGITNDGVTNEGIEIASPKQNAIESYTVHCTPPVEATAGCSSGRRITEGVVKIYSTPTLNNDSFLSIDESQLFASPLSVSVLENINIVFDETKLDQGSSIDNFAVVSTQHENTAVYLNLIDTRTTKISTSATAETVKCDDLISFTPAHTASKAKKTPNYLEATTSSLLKSKEKKVSGGKRFGVNTPKNEKKECEGRKLFSGSKVQQSCVAEEDIRLDVEAKCENNMNKDVVKESVQIELSFKLPANTNTASSAKKCSKLPLPKSVSKLPVLKSGKSLVKSTAVRQPLINRMEPTVQTPGKCKTNSDPTCMLDMEEDSENKDINNIIRIGQNTEQHKQKNNYAVKVGVESHLPRLATKSKLTSNNEDKTRIKQNSRLLLQTVRQPNTNSTEPLCLSVMYSHTSRFDC